MRNLTLALIALAGLAAIAALEPPSGNAQDNKQDNKEVRAADRPPVPFTPGLGDLMNILIQPRHAKLGTAGHEENWAVAGYALKEIKQSFARIAAAVPKWKDKDVAEMIETAMNEPITVLDFAIKAGEPHQFATAYGRFTAGCNACHASAEHSFIVIKAPDASGFPNEDFKRK